MPHATKEELNAAHENFMTYVAVIQRMHHRLNAEAPWRDSPKVGSHDRIQTSSPL